MSNQDKVHRDVYESAFGPIPSGYHIHHVDGDHSNNDPEHLMAVSKRFHKWLHGNWYRNKWHAYGYVNLVRRGTVTRTDLERLHAMFEAGEIPSSCGFVYAFIDYVKGNQND